MKEPSVLKPGLAERPSTYLWSDRPAHKPESWPISLPVLDDTVTVSRPQYPLQFFKIRELFSGGQPAPRVRLHIILVRSLRFAGGDTHLVSLDVDVFFF